MARTTEGYRRDVRRWLIAALGGCGLMLASIAPAAKGRTNDLFGLAPELVFQKTVTTADGACGVDDADLLMVVPGDTVRYCYTVINPGTAILFDVVIIDDNGTPGVPGDDFFVLFDPPLPNLDGQGDAGDLPAGESATAQVLRTFDQSATVVNTAIARGNNGQPGSAGQELSESDSATVVISMPGMTGACCADLTCSVTAMMECVAGGGTYAGDETSCADGDGDGAADVCDGCPNDPNKTEPGICGCGVPDDDSDEDGVADCEDGCPNDPDKTEPGICGCGVPDDDSDEDGVADCEDGCPDDPDKTEPGICGCGVPDDGCLSGADRVSGSEKGSLLIFSKVEIRWDTAGNVIQDTFLNMANDWPQDVQVQMYFVNGDPPLDEPGVRFHPGWNWVDVGTWLTKNQPAYWSALTGQPGPGGAAVSRFTILDPSNDPLAQGRPAPDGTTDRVLRGFVYAWAVDSQNREISWNHLKGDATLVDYRGSSAWEYNAWSFQDAQGLPPGTLLNSPYGQLDLDGIEYVAGYAQLQLDFYAAGSSPFDGGGGPVASTITLDTDLTLHPIQADLRQETNGPVTTKANFVIWNEDETQLTGLHRCITCWDQTLLSLYAPVGNHFLMSNLQTDKGRARIDGIASQVCDFLPPYFDASQSVSLLGVAAKRLTFGNGTSFAAGGLNLTGMGAEPRAAAILYDVIGGGGGPPTLVAPEDEGAQQLRWTEQTVERALKPR